MPDSFKLCVTVVLLFVISVQFSWLASTEEQSKYTHFLASVYKPFVIRWFARVIYAQLLALGTLLASALPGQRSMLFLDTSDTIPLTTNFIAYTL